MRYLPQKVAIAILLTISSVVFLSQTPSDGDLASSLENQERRRLSAFDPKTVLRKNRQLGGHAKTWCEESLEAPLPYENCNADDIVYRIPLFGGMTNALKFVLLGTILAFEENRCFFVDEGEAELNTFDKKYYHDGGFIQRYFEKIGLSNEHPIVRKAYDENRLRSLTFKELWMDLRARRRYSEFSTIKSLDYIDIENYELKKIMMRRMWRPKPEVRERTCQALQDYGLHDDFISFSVRRGDKSMEKFDFITMQDYVASAEEAIEKRFNGVVPPVFVATDDCSVLPTLRIVRPDWRFVSECDKAKQEGFALSAMNRWSHEETDAHFGKFFIELYAMALSKYFIGVAYTNVAWWAFFMRNDRDSFKLLDFRDREEEILGAW